MSEAPMVFHFHPATGEFAGSSNADADPMDAGRWVLQASATLTAPPEPAFGFAPVFANDAWQQVEDHRGETWWDDDGQAVVIGFLGDPAAEGLSATAPEPEVIITSAMVNAERDERIAAGTTISVSGYGDIPLTGTDRDKTLITAMLIRAQGAHAAGVTSASMVIRDRDNVIHNLTPLQMLELTSKGMQWVEDTMTVSWAMKDGTAPFEQGIPLDYADDRYWP